MESLNMYNKKNQDFFFFLGGEGVGKVFFFFDDIALLVDASSVFTVT